MITQSDISKSDKNGPEINAIGSSEIKIVNDCLTKKNIRLLMKYR